MEYKELLKDKAVSLSKAQFRYGTDELYIRLTEVFMIIDPIIEKLSDKPTDNLKFKYPDSNE